MKTISVVSVGAVILAAVAASGCAVQPAGTEDTAAGSSELTKGGGHPWTPATVHLGAHADAPSHYGRGPAIHERSLDYYLGPCQVMHVAVPPGTRVLVLVAVVGFIPAIAIFIFVYMHFGFKEPALHAAAYAAATTLLCWGLFHQLLAVAWPQSYLGDFFPALRSSPRFI